MIWFLASALYLISVAIFARQVHIRRSIEWMRWKNAGPELKVTTRQFEPVYGAYSKTKARQDVDLWEYLEKHSGGFRPRHAWFWPVLVPLVMIEKFCFPEVKMPDSSVIKTLENELEDLE